jgi:hypothetical protein
MMRKIIGAVLGCLIAAGAIGSAHAQALDARNNLSDLKNPAAALANLGAAATFTPAFYGAICNGVSNPISGTSLPQTVAGLAAYTNAAGQTPYSWLTNGNWYFHVALVLPNGATNGSTNLTVYSVAGLAAGMIVTSTTTGAIPTNDTIASVHAASGSALPYITLTTATTAAIPVYQVSSTNTNYIEVKQASGTQPTDAQIAAAEVDWLAVQSAIQAASVATGVNGGGNVVLPSSECMMSNASSPGTAVGTLMIPAVSSDVNWTGTGMNIMSAGTPINAVLYWPTDLGAGRYGLSADVPWADPANGAGRYGYNFYYGKLDGVQLLGPGANFTLGAAPTVAMTGYADGARRRLDFAAVRGFLNGVSFLGDHSPWYDVELNANQQYGAYWDYPNASLGGDNYCYSCQFSGNGFAGIAINYAATNNWYLDGSYDADNPCALYGEPIPSGAPAAGMTTAAFHVVNGNWEWNYVQVKDQTGGTFTYNNGAITGVTDGTASRQFAGTFDSVYFSAAGYGGPNPTIPAFSNRATVDVGNIGPLHLIHGSDFSAGGTNGDFGTASLFNAGVVGEPGGGLYMQGDITALIADLNANGKQFINGSASNYFYNTKLEELGEYTARLYSVSPSYCSGGTPTVGQVVELIQSCAGGAVSVGGYAASAPVLGVLASGIASGVGIIINSGANVSVKAGGTIAFGYYVKKSTNGTVVQATGITDSAIGIAGSAIANGSTGGIDLFLIP